MPDSPKLTDVVPTDALKDAGQKLLSLMVQRAAETAADRVSGLTDRLNAVADSGGTGLREAFRGRSDDDSDDRDSDRDSDDDSDDDSDGEGGGGLLSGLKDTVGGLFGGGKGGGGGGKKLKVTQIVEDHDIGLPLRVTYNLWTQFGDFPTFMKKVESVNQTSDEKTKWKAQVFLSHREWEATIIEQVPDSHIVWKSSGTKGHVDGAVTFSGLGPNLTKVMLVLEYYPRGLFERTGNIWRAQGRRARLEFQHFKRHAMTNVLVRQDEVEGWRGEIRDSEVVKTHEEALEEEERDRQDESADQEPDDVHPEDARDGDRADEQEDDPDAETAETDYNDDEYDDDLDEDDEPADEDDEYEDEDLDEDTDEDTDGDEPADEDDEYDEDLDEPDDEPQDEPEEQPRRRSRRQTAGSGARGRR